MFKTMDGVKVYDKQDIDQSLGIPEANVTGTAFERIAGTEERLTRAERKLENKVDESELAPLVHEEVDSIIGTKVNEIAGTFEDTIDGKVASSVNTAFSDYDTSSQVDTKIATAIGDIPAGPSAMTASEATALINTYF